MNEYIKPHIDLPISLFDSEISSMQKTDSSLFSIDGTITFCFDNGYHLFDGSQCSKTGKSKVIISGVEYNSSAVLYRLGSEIREVTFDQLMEDINANLFIVIEESYGIDRSNLICNMHKDDTWYEVQIRITHFDKTKYIWE